MGAGSGRARSIRGGHGMVSIHLQMAMVFASFAFIGALVLGVI
jgi:hypothetical protein